MPGLNELAQRHTELEAADLERLRLVLADWQLLADLSFSDLVLWLPTWNRSGYVAAAQRRPTTGPTRFTDDLVGTFLPRGREPAVDEALTQGRLATTASVDSASGVRGIPLHGSAGVVAVVAQHPSVERDPSRLEQTYLEVAQRLALMMAQGTFPAQGQAGEDSPRVGDGLIVLDTDGCISYASPNAVSAYRRLGLAADLLGVDLAETTRSLSPRRGAVDADPSSVLRGRAVGAAEIEAKGAVVALRVIPLLADGRRTGALVLLRDVSDLRRRERELLTKDATIREIHHRVKNNLQTVAALLRLQARRLAVPDAVTALQEAERRVAAIAVVHELLSTSVEPDVPFDDIADRLLVMVTDLAKDPAGPVITTRREGTFGSLDVDLATPLALVLAELVQNAVEHGLAGRAGTVLVRPRSDKDQLTVLVDDDGVGLPWDFHKGASTGLGLQIARMLLADLGGEVDLVAREGGGTRAAVRLPLELS